MIEKYLKYLIFSNFVTAVSGGVLAWGVAHFLGVKNAPVHGAFISLGIFSVYNLQRIIKSRQSSINSEWLTWVKKNSLFLLSASFLSGLTSLFLYFFIEYHNYIGLYVLGLGMMVSLWYVIPIGGIKLRMVPLIKAPLVAITWTIILIYLPISTERNILEYSTFLGAFFLYFLGVTIPFDIRDLSIDDQSQRTVPILFGLSGAKWISILFLIGSYSLFAIFNINMRFNVIFTVSFLITVLLIYRLHSESKEFDYAVIDLSMSFLGIAFYCTSA